MKWKKWKCSECGDDMPCYLKVKGYNAVPDACPYDPARSPPWKRVK